MKNAKIGKGVILARVLRLREKLLSETTLKNGVAIWNKIEDFVFVGPYAVFTNDLKPRAFIKRTKTLFKNFG